MFYYLHQNGELIFKKRDIDEEVLESSFVKEAWQLHEVGASPSSFLAFLLEAAELGALRERVEGLAATAELEKYIPSAAEDIAEKYEVSYERRIDGV